MTMKKLFYIALFLVPGSAALQGQPASSWPVRMAETLMRTHRDSFVYDRSKPARWDYELGLYLKALEQLWRQTGNGDYFRYIEHQMDFFIGDNGAIRTYKPEVYNIDHITPGRALLLLWQQTGKEKYRLAAQQLRGQLAGHPRTHEGGFWHKKVYPWQMWLDGLYMGEPFYAEYGRLFGEPQNFDDVANQLTWMEAHARDARTGLLYHAWDESREQAWANKTTGQSPHFWGRAMGWYAMALVDVLDYFPADHPRRGELVGVLQRLAAAITSVQEPSTGLWYQVLDKAGEPGNYREASASCMFAYALLKGARLGYIDAAYQEAGKKAFAGILREFMTQDADGSWHLEKVCMVAGLGGNPYRDGSYGYYVSEPIRRDDLKGAAPFILAGLEMEKLASGWVGRDRTVVLDRYFNNEYRDGERFHYTWEDTRNSGYSWWGQLLRDLGARTTSLDAAPTAENLRGADVYIVVDPDTKKETAAPHFVEPAHVAAITEWVRGGGTLVLLANDTANCEHTRFNTLAAAFGLRFTDRSRNLVRNDRFEQGAVPVPVGHPIFRRSRKLYIKELSTLAVQAPARAVLSEGSDVVMATCSLGAGRVFALGDPWLYNEYVDGKKLPAGFDNFQAARDLSVWLLQPPSTAPADRAAAEVATAVEQLRAALLQADRPVLERLTAAGLSYGHSSGKVEDRAAFIDGLASGSSVFDELALADQVISVTGNTAIVRHTLWAATNDAGKGPGALRLAVLLVWIKENQTWKLLARQALKI
jgi:unsaturated rhamnogalacturonyl hydrolase